MATPFSEKNSLHHQQGVLNSTCVLNPHGITVSIMHLGLPHTTSESYWKFLHSSEVPVSSFCQLFFSGRATSPPRWGVARFLSLLCTTEILQLQESLCVTSGTARPALGMSGWLAGPHGHIEMTGVDSGGHRPPWGPSLLSVARSGVEVSVIFLSLW